MCGRAPGVVRILRVGESATTKHSFSVKTFVTTFSLTLALCAAAGATAQSKSTAAAPAPDTVMLSETTDGDYLVRRFVVQRLDDTSFSVLYRIDSARLVSTLGHNAQELAELDSFVSGIRNDTLRQLRSVVITGYASPDGPMKFNRTLALQRAQDLKGYADAKYGLSQHCVVTVNSVVEPWSACRALVAASQMPDRQAVLDLLDSKLSDAALEAKLKAMPAAWNYLRHNILPTMRRAAMTVVYRDGNVVVQRTMLPKAAPEPAPAANACAGKCPCEVIDRSITGIIVEMPGEDAGQERRQLRREVRGEVRDLRHDVRVADKIGKEQARAAKRIARKEAKAARKAEKAAVRSARELEKMR